MFSEIFKRWKGVGVHYSGQAMSLYNPGVNFINVLHTNFSYEHHFPRYILALSKLSYEKFSRLTLMKLTEGVSPTELMHILQILVTHNNASVLVTYECK